MTHHSCLYQKFWSKIGLLVFCGAVLIADASFAADSDAPDPNVVQAASPWPKWVKGMELGIRALGRFGTGSSINNPPGDVLLNLSGHIWHDHIVSAHASLGFGLAHSTLALGLGAKLNLFEIAEVSKVSVSSTQTGVVRGVATGFLKNFMIFLGLDLTYFIFPAPAAGSGLTYSSSLFALLPGVGGQLYFNVESSFVRKIYVEASASYMFANQANYIIPYLGIGLELR